MFFQAQQVQPIPFWWSVIGAALGSGVPTILWLIDNRKRATKEAHEEQEKIRMELEEKHKENTKRLNHQDEKLDEILNERKYLPPHGHRENAGLLSAENIYPRR